MSRILRRTGPLAVLVLALTGLTTSLATPASAATGGGCARSAVTSFHVQQGVCFSYVNGRMQGYGGIEIFSGFNPANVTSCSIYLQLTSNYGPPRTPEGPYDCLLTAKSGPGFSAQTRPIVDYGPGRQAGDTYKLYSWVEIRSGSPYSGRGTPAVVSITL
jgi:hypothetical protein